MGVEVWCLLSDLQMETSILVNHFLEENSNIVKLSFNEHFFTGNICDQPFAAYWAPPTVLLEAMEPVTFSPSREAVRVDGDAINLPAMAFNIHDD